MIEQNYYDLGDLFEGNYNNNELQSFSLSNNEYDYNPFKNNIFNDEYDYNPFENKTINEDIASNDYRHLYLGKFSPFENGDKKVEISLNPLMNFDNEKKGSNDNGRTKTTAEKTMMQEIMVKKMVSKEKIFNIKKVKKVLGRKPKEIFAYTRNNKKVHTKDDKDNIIIKIKRNVYNHSSEQVNYSLKTSPNPNLNTLELKKINNSILIVHKKEENQQLMRMEMEKIFSNKLSRKYSKENPNHNIITINFISRQNDKKVNSQLKTTF